MADQVWDEESGEWVDPPPPRPMTEAFKREVPAEPENPPEPPPPEPEPEPKRGRGRPRKYPLGMTYYERKKLRDSIPQPEEKKEEPPADDEGRVGARPIKPKRDRAYYASLLETLNKSNFDSIESGAGGLPNYKSSLDGLLAEAALNGVDPKNVVDGRSDTDRFAEAVERFQQVGFDILEAQEPMIAAMEAGLDKIKKMSEDYLAEKMTQALARTVEDEHQKKRADLEKRWRRLIARVRALREKARNPVPKGTSPKESHLWAAVHKLRVMLYAMRTNLSDRQKAGGPASLMDIKMHHVRMAWEVYRGRRGLEITHTGIFDRIAAGYRYGRWDGTILVLPPGCGKTSYATADCAVDIALNPHEKLLIGHAQEDVASANLVYLSSFFEQNNPIGRRFATLYPGLELESKSKTHFRLKLKEKSRQPTCRAHGASARISGSDATKIWFDDMVDQSEREQPEERRRKFEIIEGTWMKRLRGRDTYHLTTTTLWHDQDATSRRIQLVMESKLNVNVLIMAHGGPEPSALKGVFESIWPEVITSDSLRQQYAADPVLYAAICMSDPRPESQQIIRKLRYYDPACEEHRRFMAGATFHLTVDPAATKNKRSDKAGILYCALGQVEGEGPNGEMISESRLRIVEAWEILTTIGELKDRIAAICMSRSVHYVHVEVQGVGTAIPEWLMNDYGVDVVQHLTGNRDKESRLRSVGVTIEHSGKDKNFGGAVVEFPGKSMAGMTWAQPDANYAWLYEQFLRFGSTNKDHSVDALGQLIGRLVTAGDLHPGAGFVTQKLLADASVKGDPRILAMLSEAMEGRKHPNAAVEDAAFWNSGSEGSVFR